MKEQEKQYLYTNLNKIFGAADCNRNGMIDFEEVNHIYYSIFNFYIVFIVYKSNWSRHLYR